MAVLPALLDAADASLWSQLEPDYELERPGPLDETADPEHIAKSILILTSELSTEIDLFWKATSRDLLGLPDEPSPAPCEFDASGNIPF